MDITILKLVVFIAGINDNDISRQALVSRYLLDQYLVPIFSTFLRNSRDGTLLKPGVATEAAPADIGGDPR